MKKETCKHKLEHTIDYDKCKKCGCQAECPKLYGADCLAEPTKKLKTQKEVIAWALQDKETGKIVNVYMDRWSARSSASVWGNVDKVIKVRIIPN